MNTRFIYDEKTSSLFAPDGTFLKKVFCPKAKLWNQLITDPGELRWRGCSDCGEKVINLDAVSFSEVQETLRNEWDNTCIHASEKSQNVIFLKDNNQVQPPQGHQEMPILIQTVRNWHDIDRGFAMGYWPDIRLVEPDFNMNSKITVGQDPTTGKIEYSGDYRTNFQGNEFHSRSINGRETSEFLEVIPFTNYYPYHQQSPVAAYLVPKGLEGRTQVCVEDPIEDIVGWRWNQGDVQRAMNVPGYVENNRVVLEPREVEVRDVVG